MHAPLGNNLSEESAKQETDAAGDVPNTIRTKNTMEKQANTIFNEVRQFAYVLGARERDFIDSTINYNLFLLQGISKRDFQRIFRDTIHEGSSPYL